MDTEILEKNSQKTRLTSCGQGGYTLETGPLYIHYCSVKKIYLKKVMPSHFWLRISLDPEGQSMETVIIVCITFTKM